MREVEQVSWEAVLERLDEIDKPGEIVYGIPRGGMIASAFLNRARATHYPQQATLFLDDIIDSGRTMQKWKERFPGTPFFALFDKSPDGLDSDLGWIRFPWEPENDAEDLIVRLLEYIGEDPKREGLKDTPARVLRSFEKLYGGYSEDPGKLLQTTFSAEADEMIILRDIELYSTCEHHMLPFVGVCHIGYIPSAGRVVGVSKLARLVEVFSRRLQIQEVLTTQIADALTEHLLPIGCGVVIEAKHLCMSARGVEKQRSAMSTSCLRGAFRSSPAVRAEFFSRIH